MCEPRTKPLRVKPEYLTQILAGRQTIEVRAAYRNITRLRVRDLLKLNEYEVVPSTWTRR